jgi:hypothetical protein
MDPLKPFTNIAVAAIFGAVLTGCGEGDDKFDTVLNGVWTDGPVWADENCAENSMVFFRGLTATGHFSAEGPDGALPELRHMALYQTSLDDNGSPVGTILREGQNINFTFGDISKNTVTLIFEEQQLLLVPCDNDDAEKLLKEAKDITSAMRYPQALLADVARKQCYAAFFDKFSWLAGSDASKIVNQYRMDEANYSNAAQLFFSSDAVDRAENHGLRLGTSLIFDESVDNLYEICSANDDTMRKFAKRELLQHRFDFFE